MTFNIDKHGCVYIQSAQLMEEIPDEPAAPAEGKEAAAGEEAKEEGVWISIFTYFKCLATRLMICFYDSLPSLFVRSR